MGEKTKDDTVLCLTLEGSGFAMVGIYILEGIWTATATKRRRTCFGLMGGLLLLQALEFLFAGRNPLVSSWLGIFMFSVIPGIFVSILIFFEDLFDWEGEDVLTTGGGGEGGEEGEEDLEFDTMMSDDMEQTEGGEEGEGEGEDSARDSRGGSPRLGDEANFGRFNLFKFGNGGLKGFLKRAFELVSYNEIKSNPYAEISLQKFEKNEVSLKKSEFSPRKNEFSPRKNGRSSSHNSPKETSGRFLGSKGGRRREVEGVRVEKWVKQGINMEAREEREERDARQSGQFEYVMSVFQNGGEERGEAREVKKGERMEEQRQEEGIQVEIKCDIREEREEEFVWGFGGGQVNGPWAYLSFPGERGGEGSGREEEEKEGEENSRFSGGEGTRECREIEDEREREVNHQSGRIHFGEQEGERGDIEKGDHRFTNGRCKWKGGERVAETMDENLIHLEEETERDRSKLQDLLSGKRWGEGEEVPWKEEKKEGWGGGGEGEESDDSEVGDFRQRQIRVTGAGILRTLQMGTGFGSLLFYTHWILSSPSILPRWLGVSPLWGLLTIFFLSLGLVFVAEVARKLLPKRVNGLLAWIVVVLGSYFLMSQNVSDFRFEKMSKRGIEGGAGAGTPGTLTMNMDIGNYGTGGPFPSTNAVGSVNGHRTPLDSFQYGAPLVSFAVPSLWIVMGRNMFGVYPGLGLGFGMFWYLFLFLWSTGLVAYQEMGGIFRGTGGVLMGLTLGGIAVGLERGPDVSEEERRDFLAGIGAWRAGRLTWGSGVPDRKSLGAFLTIISVVILVAVGLRGIYTPRKFNFGQDQTFRVLNFNVQQGFNRAGKNNFEALRKVFRDQKPHVIMLQETDLSHIVHGNQDLVDYLSTWEKMYSLFTPPTRSDTWGCAILSVFPFKLSASEILPSRKGENSCFQYATIVISDLEIHLMNTHFGDLDTDIDLQVKKVSEIVFSIIGIETDTVKNNTNSSSSEHLSNSTTALTEAFVNSKKEDKKHFKKPLVFAGDFNVAPLSTPYNGILSKSLLYDTRAAIKGPYKSSKDRDPGAGYVLSSSDLQCVSWEEPHYPQKETSDGYPLVVGFKVDV